MRVGGVIGARGSPPTPDIEGSRCVSYDRNQYHNPLANKNASSNLLSEAITYVASDWVVCFGMDGVGVLLRRASFEIHRHFSDGKTHWDWGSITFDVVCFRAHVLGPFIDMRLYFEVTRCLKLERDS